MRAFALAFGLLCSLLAPASAEEGTATALLIEAGLAEQLGGEIPEAATWHLTLPEGAPAHVTALLQLEQDLRSSQFAARVETLEGQDLVLRGRFEARLSVPVPRRSIQPGEVASGEDFNFVSLPYQSLGRYAVLDLREIEGREVRRVLSPGRPVPTQSLRDMVAVARGERLMLSYNQGGLVLTAPAKALEDAGIDQPLRVLNLSSNKTVTAIARADGRVEILR